MKVGPEPKTPAQIDEVIVDLVQRQGALDEELGRWLLLAQRARVHRHLGFAAFGDYVAARLGVTPRLAKERASVAEALEALPLLRRALVTGSRSWSAVRELSRVATPDTEAAWLEASAGKNLRALEGLVSGRRPGDGPEAPPDPLLAQHRAVFVQTSDQRATTVEALARARRILGPEATDGAVLAFMCEDFLGRKRNLEEGAGYQVSLTLCAECRSAHRPVAGEVLPVSDAVRDCALCDPELVGLTPAARPEPFGDAGAARRTIPVGEVEGAEGRSTHVGRAEGAQGRSTHVGQVEGAEGQLLQASGTKGAEAPTHVGQAAGADEPSHQADLPEGAAEQSTHVGQAEGADGPSHQADLHESAEAQSTRVGSSNRPGVRSTQGCLGHGAEAPLTHVGRRAREGAAFHPDSHRAALADLLRRGGLGAVLKETSAALGLHLHSVTPKLRRLVLARDHHRCVVPGCTRHLFIDLHHLQRTKDGGPNTPDNLITLCSTHHRQHHEGYLGIEGTPSRGLTFHTPRGRLHAERAQPNAA